MSKSYTGPRIITAQFHAEETRRTTLRRADGTWEDYDEATGPEYVSRQAHWAGHIDGRTYYGLCGKTEADALATAGRLATRMDADDAWYDRCKAVAGQPSAGAWMETPRGTAAADFFVGQRVSIYSRGDARVGLVEKVGKTNVHVIYVTASTGNIWRKAGKFAEVGILESAAPESEPEPELCDHVDTERVERTAHGYLGDAPRGTRQLLCAACGEELVEAGPPAGMSDVSLRGLRKMADQGLTIKAIAEKTGLLVSEVQEALEGHQPPACPHGLCDTSGRARATTGRCIYCQEDEARRRSAVDEIDGTPEVEEEPELLECLDDRRGGCHGPVELRPSLTGTGTAIARCDKHWQARLDKEEEWRVVYPDSPNPPAWFDPANAGETWNEDY